MNRKFYASVLSLIFLSLPLILWTGCGSSNSSKVQVNPTVTAMSGTPQSAGVTTAFAAPLVAKVTTGGSATSGVVVTFTAPTTGASGTFAGGVNTATTNSSGVATSAVFTANVTAGAYTVTATTPGAATTASFSLTNTGGAASITATSGTSQSAAINTAFAGTLVATVRDSGSNPVSGAVVTFTAPTTGASGSFAGGVNTATTNSLGVATSAIFTANATAGAYVVTGSTPGAATSASFSLSNTALVAASVAATSGTPQSASVSTAFGAPLVVTVLDSSLNPVSGATVTFTPPATGASGAFAGGVTTATTNSSGVATSGTFTANATAGAYVVTATVAGVSTAATFSLTNTAVATSNYSFYLSGLERVNSGPNYYALAGSVTIDANGHVVAGEQDYNDGFGLTSPQPAGDAINGGTLTIDDPTSGQGTLTLLTNDAALGVGGTETLGVQFVNTKHALIVQFDGSATASGSMDFQTVSSTLNDGNYAFTLSGVDPGYLSIVVGGVFTVSNSGTTLAGVYDVDDAGAATTPTLGTAFGGTVSAPDAFGRGTITGAGIATILNYYIVGPEVIRIIDVDPSHVGMVSDSAIGSAFGQGSGTFSNTSIGNSVWGVESNSDGNLFAAAGQIKVPASGTFQGVADDDEVDNLILASNAPISGTYSIASNGYGSLLIAPGQLGGVSVLGMYMIDPTLNLNDPNNTTSGLGGALIADLDGNNLNGVGVLIPQTDATSARFVGNYAFGAQEYSFENVSSSGWEFDFVGLGSVSAGGVFSGTGLVSDPFIIFSGTPPSGTDSVATFSGTAVADTNPLHLGRYTLPLNISAGVCSSFSAPVIIYQASGEQLLWIDGKSNTTFLGSLQQQGSLSGLPAVKRKAGKKKIPAGIKPQC